MLELIPKKTINKEDRPPFLGSWSDTSSPDYKLNSTQFKTWTSVHLHSDRWYLERGPKYIPEAEKIISDTAENANDVVLLEDDDGAMDEATRTKAIAKIHSLKTSRKKKT